MSVPVSAKSLGIDLVTRDKLDLEVLKARQAALEGAQNGWAFSISSTSFGLTLCYGMHVINSKAGGYGWALVGLLFIIGFTSGVVSFLSWWGKKSGAEEGDGN